MVVLICNGGPSFIPFLAVLFKGCIRYHFPMAQPKVRHDMEAFRVMTFPHLGLRLKIGEVYTKAELQRRCCDYPDKVWRINELELKLSNCNIFRKIEATQPSKESDPQEPARKVRKKMYVFRPGDLCCSCDEE